MNVLATNYVVRTIEIKYTDIPILRAVVLPDRTNGRAYATVLRPSVAVVCDVMHCG